MSLHEKLSALQRRDMIRQVRGGASARSVARQFDVSLSHLQHWLQRAHGLRLDRVDWNDQTPGPATPSNRTSALMEVAILTARKGLLASDLGEWGAQAIHARLSAAAASSTSGVPSVRTIGRVLQRRGILDSKQRTRRPPPPRGWYLPLLASGEAELDSFDIVEGLALAGGTQVEVLNAMSLHGRLPGSWPQGVFTSLDVMACLLAHWRRHGLPHYVQFDNAPLFHGSASYADKLGRVVRLCLQLDVIPVFAPPRETGFQAAIESYNARWQAKVWLRFPHPGMQALAQRSIAYVAACQVKAEAHITAAASLRRAFAEPAEIDLKSALKGRVIFLRRTNEEGEVTVMGRRYLVDPHWQHRLVRVEVNFITAQMQFFGLRRAAHAAQPLLLEMAYKPAAKQPGGLRSLRDGATRGRRLDKKPAKP